MIFDTHTHIYLPEFDNDCGDVVVRAKEKGVAMMMLPNVDVETIAPLKNGYLLTLNIQKNKTIPISTNLLITVAIAAPTTPNLGKPNNPKINNVLKIKLTKIAITPHNIGINVCFISLNDVA